MLGKMRLSRV